MSNTMKFKTRLVAAALSAVWLSGCGSLMRSDYQAPAVQVPANWQQMQVAGDVSMDLGGWRLTTQRLINTLLRCWLKTTI